MRDETATEELLRRCQASVLRIADLIQDDDDTSAIETCHHIADDLETLLERA